MDKEMITQVMAIRVACLISLGDWMAINAPGYAVGQITPVPRPASRDNSHKAQFLAGRLGEHAEIVGINAAGLADGFASPPAYKLR